MYSTSTGEPRPIFLGPIETAHWVRWQGDRHFIVVGAARGRPSRLWRVPWDTGAPIPLTAEGLFGICYVSPDETRVAFITDQGQGVVVPIDAPHTLQGPPGQYRGERACGFHGQGAGLFVRTLTSPIRIRRVDLATGDSVPHAEVPPPRWD